MSDATSSSLALSSPDMFPTQLVILGEDGAILYISRVRWEFGTERDCQGDSSSVGMNYLGVCDLSVDADATTASESIHAVIDDDRDEFSFEYSCETPEERLWFTIRATRLTDDGETHVQIAHLDITDRKRVELEAEEKAGCLRNLAWMLSHDLRSPLSVAAGYVESLLDETAVSDRLERVAGAFDRMDDIITDALMLARHDTVEGLSTVDFETRAATAREHVGTGTATLVVTDSVEFRADSNPLRHMFENLFRNPAEHGASDGDLTVTAGVLDGDTAEVGFYAKDNGTGIPTETCNMVFEAGYSMGEEGTGFGLPIVAQAVRTHDWDVAITEAEGGGAHFEITGVGRPAQRTGAEARSTPIFDGGLAEPE